MDLEQRVRPASVEEVDFEKPEGLSEKESREWDEFVANWKAQRKG